MRPDRRERVRRSASASGPNAPKVEIISMISEGRDAKDNKANTGGGLATGEVAEVGALPLPLEVEMGGAAGAVGMAGPDPSGAGDIEQLNVNDDASAGAVDILKDEVRAVQNKYITRATHILPKGLPFRQIYRKRATARDGGTRAAQQLSPTRRGARAPISGSRMGGRSRAGREGPQKRRDEGFLDEQR